MKSVDSRFISRTYRFNKAGGRRAGEGAMIDRPRGLRPRAGRGQSPGEGGSLSGRDIFIFNPVMLCVSSTHFGFVQCGRDVAGVEKYRILGHRRQCICGRIKWKSCALKLLYNNRIIYSVKKF